MAGEIPTLHQPVLVAEAVEYLNPKPGDVIFDGTLGYGGHTSEICKRLKGQGFVIGCDLDPEAIEYCRKKFAGEPVKIVESNFYKIREILNEMGIEHINSVLFDLGVSSAQLDCGERGFSIMRNGPLNMRFDGTNTKTVPDLLTKASEERLAEIFKQYGEERYSRRIAKAIKKALRETSIKTTGELSEIITRAIPGKARNLRIHPATRVFQALRIAVNDELESLRKVLPAAIDVLEPGGRIAAISYHSLEDRIVKQSFQECLGICKCPPGMPVCSCGAEAKIRILTRKPVRPGQREIEENPRSRSAKLRAAEKLDVLSKQKSKGEYN